MLSNGRFLFLFFSSTGDFQSTLSMGKKYRRQSWRKYGINPYAKVFANSMTMHGQRLWCLILIWGERGQQILSVFFDVKAKIHWVFPYCAYIASKISLTSFNNNNCNLSYQFKSYLCYYSSILKHSLSLAPWKG